MENNNKFTLDGITYGKYFYPYNRMPYCNEPCGAILDVHDKNLYMFKKVEYIESIILKK